MESGYSAYDACIALIKQNVIKATKDSELADSLYFSPDVINFAMGALRAGLHIICDTKAIKASLHNMPMVKLEVIAHYFVENNKVVRKANESAATRAVIAIEYAVSLRKPFIFVIGNSPASLTRLNELTAAGAVSPKLVIATPVGYSDAVECKKKLIELGVPSIVSLGMKGGSDAAASICNTLLDLAAPPRLS